MKRLVPYVIAFILGAALVSCGQSQDATPETITVTEYATVTETVEVEVPGELSDACLDLISIAERLYDNASEINGAQGRYEALYSKARQSIAMNEIAGTTAIVTEMRMLDEDLYEYFNNLATDMLAYETAREECNQ